MTTFTFYHKTDVNLINSYGYTLQETWTNTVTTRNEPPIKFLFVLIEEFSLVAFSNAIEPLRLANRIAKKQVYTWELASEGGQKVTCSNGIPLDVNVDIYSAGISSYIVICSGENVRKHTTKPLMSWIRKEARKDIVVGAICTGTYILAKAGILNDSESTIHWENQESLREEFSDLTISGSIYSIGKRRFTSAGGIASLDLMLNIIAKELNIEVAKLIADQMIHDSIRTNMDKQLPSIPNRIGARNPKLLTAIKSMENNIEEPLSPLKLAENLGISIRQLERLFQRYFSQSPKRYYMALRLQKARNLLLQTEMNVLQIALACGFSSSSHFSKCYKSEFNITPHNERGFANQWS